MQTLTMERIKELDVVSGEDVLGFLRHVRLVTFFHEDNTRKIREMAQRAGISPERFSSYAWLQAYIRELARSCNDAPAPENVAQQFGIDWLDFQEYFLDRAETFRDESISIEDDTEDDDFRRPQQQSFPPDPWEEDEDRLADLQEDAGLQGD